MHTIRISITKPWFHLYQHPTFNPAPQSSDAETFMQCLLVAFIYFHWFFAFPIASLQNVALIEFIEPNVDDTDIVLLKQIDAK